MTVRQGLWLDGTGSPSSCLHPPLDIWAPFFKLNWALLEAVCQFSSLSENCSNIWQSIPDGWLPNILIFYHFFPLLLLVIKCCQLVWRGLSLLYSQLLKTKSRIVRLFLTDGNPSTPLPNSARQISVCASAMEGSGGRERWRTVDFIVCFIALMFVCSRRGICVQFSGKFLCSQAAAKSINVPEYSSGLCHWICFGKCIFMPKL